MNATPVPPALPSARSRGWIAWLVVAIAGAAIGLSFVLRSDDEAATSNKTGGKATPVTVVDVATGPMTQRGRYPGELDADTADVAAFYAGRIVAVRVRVGDTVKANDIVGSGSNRAPSAAANGELPAGALDELHE